MDLVAKPLSIFEKSWQSGEVPADRKKGKKEDTESCQPHLCAWEVHGTHPPRSCTKTHAGQRRSQNSHHGFSEAKPCLTKLVTSHNGVTHQWTRKGLQMPFIWSSAEETQSPWRSHSSAQHPACHLLDSPQKPSVCPTLQLLNTALQTWSQVPERGEESLSSSCWLSACTDSLTCSEGYSENLNTLSTAIMKDYFFLSFLK
ncbi:uncharacterized protein LOC120499233 [Passer montanus]|uniref:uncharacterized protein LOC120499233 n=1 Tax=Passer montanus TaxID=9160 RepID=UPI00195FE302|nr:uncharacterized protein LOC120499233 [Passer montanus]